MKINEKYKLAITPPEEGAGAAYNAVKTSLLDRFSIPYHILPMDMATRVLTNSAAVKAASQYVRKNPDVTYVKGPGITPRDDQTLDTVIWLESQGKLHFTEEKLETAVEEKRKTIKPTQSEDKMIDFAYAVAGSTKAITYRGKELKKHKGVLGSIGSPNAAWRNELEANLSRGATEILRAHSLVTPPEWNEKTPLTIHAFSAKEGENMLTKKLEKGQTVKVVFAGESGKTIEIGEHKISDGSYTRLFTAEKEAVKEWVDEVLAKTTGEQLLNGTKQTVLKTFDGNMLNWMSAEVTDVNRDKDIIDFARPKKEKDGTQPKGFGDRLVDDVFARLGAEAPKKPLNVLAPNPSYGAYVKDVWDLIKKKGGFKPPIHSEIVRAAATGDEYISDKITEIQAPEAGTLQVLLEDGTPLITKHLEKGDVAKFMYFDRKRVKEMLERSLEEARKSGKKNIILGFKDDDNYYHTAIEEYEKLKGRFRELNVEILPSAEATAKYFTNGVKDTTLILSNIRGDFATDIELLGKGTSYSTGVIYDGRRIVELGSGGTAPDLLEKWRDEGILLFNPLSFVEGISLAMNFAAENMGKKSDNPKLAKAISEAIEHGLYASTDKGITLPIVKGSFKKNKDVPDYIPVSTQTFVKSVELEAMRHLFTEPGIDAQSLGITEKDIAQTHRQLDRMIKIDTAIFAANKKYDADKSKDLAGQYVPGTWGKANRAYHEARSHMPTWDFSNPDYTIALPDNMDISRLNADTLMALQKARAEVIETTDKNRPAPEKARGALRNAVMALGLPSQEADAFVRSDITSFLGSNALALAV